MDLRNEVADRFKPFLDAVLSGYQEKIHSVYITGSALTPDFDSRFSDINSVIVLNKMDLLFLRHLAPLGKKYGEKKVSAPLIMTPAYIATSADVFPIEFLNIKMLHYPVYGEDIFKDLEIQRAHLRHQCERELKAKLIGLRQGYLSSMGNRNHLTRSFVDAISGYMPLFRGIILLLDMEPPIKNDDVLKKLQEASGVDTHVFKEVLNVKKKQTKLSKERLNAVFEDYYGAVEKLMEITDGIAA